MPDYRRISNLCHGVGFVRGVLEGLSWQVNDPQGVLVDAIAACMERLDEISDFLKECLEEDTDV